VSCAQRLALGLLLLGATTGADSQPEPPRSELPPAAAPLPEAPRLDPRATTGVVPFYDIKLQLELGRWSIEKLSALLARAQAEHTDPNARLSFLLEQLVHTPFEYEARLPLPPPDTLRVRMESFGCTGLVIYLLALNGASSFEEFVLALRRLRYLESETRGIHSDPAHGNLLDFPEEIFLKNAHAMGLVRDVTAEVAGTAKLSIFRSRNVPRRRNAEEDPKRSRIAPKLLTGEVLGLPMISRAAFTRMDRSRIQTGDILLFSRIVPDGPPSKELLFGHAAIALNQGGEIYMIHATRDYLWRPGSKAGDPSLGAGVYYLDDPRREQIGVGPATEWVTDPEGRRRRIDNKSYYGYTPGKLRPVHDYLIGAHIQGVTVLRPTNPLAEARSAAQRFAAAVQARADKAQPRPQLASGEAQVDSEMTPEQAVRTNLARQCPAAIRERQSVVEVSYYGADGQLHKGQVVVDRSLAEDVRAVFQVIRETRFPIKSAIPIAHSAFLSDGRWDDNKSMAANNTSAFNYRAQTGSRKLSAHACGMAIDLNPLQNPYVKKQRSGKIVLPAGAVYDPSVPGTLTEDHPVTRKFKELGWKWGGEFRWVKDFQHFEKEGCAQPRS
jgi:hypothetical protein